MNDAITIDSSVRLCKKLEKLCQKFYDEAKNIKLCHLHHSVKFAYQLLSQPNKSGVKHASPTLHHTTNMTTQKLTTAGFKESVFDYETATDWKYKGTLPAIIDFYADWCGPCRMVAPLLEELAAEYDGRIIIYKVDTEAEEELSAVFRIQSIPSILFIPLEGTPMMQAGALPKHVLKQVIDEQLLGLGANGENDNAGQ